jgi:hypothetical protein
MHDPTPSTTATGEQLIEATIDPRFLLRARRALFPLPIVDRRKVVDANDVFPPFTRRPATAFEGQRVALIAGGGAGACVSLVGVRRAFEEAGVEPALITACSGGTIWGSMWAAGMSAEEMAEFSLSWHLEDYLDIQWAKVPRYAARAAHRYPGNSRISDALTLRLCPLRRHHPSSINRRSPACRSPRPDRERARRGDGGRRQRQCRGSGG